MRYFKITLVFLISNTSIQNKVVKSYLWNYIFRSKNECSKKKTFTIITKKFGEYVIRTRYNWNGIILVLSFHEIIFSFHFKNKFKIGIKMLRSDI